MIEAGELTDDDFQRDLSKKLSEMETQINAYQQYWKDNIKKMTYSSTESVFPKPKVKFNHGLFSIFRINKDENPKEDSDSYAFKPFASKSEVIKSSIIFSPFDSNNRVKGIYIFGSSGTGKTLITTKFFDYLEIQYKLKIHFFEFMDQIHKSNYENVKKGIIDPLFETAKKIATSYNTIYLDEFQVTDIADAMIIRRIFQIMWAHGLVLLTTSNRTPNNLYYNGIQRGAFLPFIDDLNQNCTIFQIKSEIDYREKMVLQELNRIFGENERVKCFLSPKSQENEELFQRYFNEYTGGKRQKSIALEVTNGRCIKFPGIGFVSKISFEFLMKSDFGASDFRAIFDHIKILFVENMTPIDVSAKNEAARFIMLIDELYNHKTKLFILSERSLNDLFINVDGSIGNEGFAIARAISRLNEIQTLCYFNLPHISGSARKFILEIN